MIIGSNLYFAIGLFGTISLMLLWLFATYPAVKAYEKGRNFVKWYIFSFLLFPMALIASFIINGKRKILKRKKKQQLKRL